MDGPRIPAVVACSLIFVSLCLAKQFAPHVGALDVGADYLEDECVPDISDMADYDPVTQTSARCEKWKRDRLRAKEQCRTKLADVERKLEECTRATGREPLDCPALPECPDDVQPTPCHDAEDMFFRRLVRHFTNVIQEKAPDSGPVEAQIQVSLSNHEWRKLQSFANGKDDYRRADIHDVMVGMTMNIVYFNTTGMMEWLGERVNLKSPAVILGMISVTVLCLVFGVGMFSDLYWNRRFMACLLTSIFVISLIWNWIYLYQEETIKRYRNAQKYEDIPPSCLPHKMTWVQALQDWFSSRTSVHTDDCFEYHRIYQVDPLFDIPPTRALSFTVSSMLVDPLKYIGRAVSEFHTEVFRDLPIWAALPALLSCYVFGFFALYAYIAAPRRVLREQPGQVRRERPAVRAARHRNLPIAARHEDGPDPEDEYMEGDRIENVRPPTLPAARQERQEPQRPRPQVPDPKRPIPPRKQGSPRKPSSGAPRGATGGREEEPSVHPKQGDEEAVLQRDWENEAGPSDLGPAARPKKKHPGPQTFPSELDGNDADTSSLDSIETITPRPRPQDLGDGRPSRPRTSPKGTSSIGSSETGSPVSHPASEKSDGESLMGSITQEPEANISYSHHVLADEETTAPSSLATGPPTPTSPISPDDISVISQSPENTNSATYDFISTSSFGLSGDQPNDPSQQEAHPELNPDEDYEDDFVVLKTEK